MKQPFTRSDPFTFFSTSPIAATSIKTQTTMSVTKLYTSFMITTLINCPTWKILTHSFASCSFVNSFVIRSMHIPKRLSAKSAYAHFANKTPGDCSNGKQSNASSAAIVHKSLGATALDPIEDAITSCLSHYSRQSVHSSIPMNAHVNILQYPSKDRESIGVASNLARSLESFARSGVHCRRCWLQAKHCVCDEVVSLEDMGIPNVEKMFILVSDWCFGFRLLIASSIVSVLKNESYYNNHFCIFVSLFVNRHIIKKYVWQ